VGLYALLLFFIFYGAGSFEMQFKHHSFNLGALAIYDFPNIWHNLSYLASYFHWILGILTIILMTNEFKFRTLRQNVIDGLSRFQILGSKILLIALFAFLSTLIIFLIGIGTGIALSNKIHPTLMVQKMGYLLTFFFQGVCYMSLALLFALVFKRTGVAVIFYLLYIIAIEPVIGYTLIDSVSAYLPGNVFNMLIVNPYSGMWGETVPATPYTHFLPVGVGYSCLLWGGSYLLLAWKDY
jgi:ABC-type transport system involved in multi-copper enzyme maturation permease subunit